MLDTQVLSVNFGAGIDTKTDSKLVVSGSLTRLENGIFTKQGQIAKAPGYDSITLNKLGGGTLSSPKGLKSYQSEIVCADSGRLYSYSSQLGVWIDKGKYQSIKVTNDYMSRSAYSASRPSAAILGNIALYAWSANGQAYAKVVDITTNTVLLQDYLLGGAESHVVATVLGTTTLGVFYNDAARNLYYRALSVSTSGVSFGIQTTVLSSLTKPTGQLTPAYDVATTPTGAVVTSVTGAAYTGTPGGTVVSTVTTIGSVLNTVTLDSSSQTSFGRSFVGSDGNIWTYWARTAASPYNFYYAIFTPTLGAVLAQTLLAQLSAESPPFQISAIPTSTTSQNVYLCGPKMYGFTALPHIYALTAASSGTVSAATQVLSGVYIMSDPISVGSSTYMAVGFPSSVQGTLFLIDLADYSVVGKAFQNKWSQGSAATNSFGSVNIRPIAYSNSKIAIPAQFVTQLDTFGLGLISQTGAGLAIFEFNHQDANQAVSAQKIQLWNGGVITLYDGNQAVELGFNTFPEITAADSGSGSGPGIGTYQYFALYRWFDAQGNMHQSAPSPGVTVQMTNTNAVTVTVPYLYLTQKTNSNSPVQILIYRTNNGGSVPYLITSVTAPKVNTPLGDYLTYTDTTAAPASPSAEVIYSNPLTPGGVVENVAPPPAMLMALHDNRVHLIDSETNDLWSSKSLQDGVGVSFSDLFAQAVDARGGDVTAIASMDDKLVACKQDLIFYQSGSGPNDTGSGSTLTNFQLVPSDIGCSQSKSVILIPNGLLIKSSKGIYLADRAMNVTYIGAPVEAYNSQKVTSAVLIKDKSQVRFLTDSGLTLFYDYVFNKWSTRTNHQGYAADNWSGVYTYARADGKIFKENPTSFLDDTSPYQLLAQTSWLKLSAVQGFQRVRRVALLGDYLGGSGHGVQISAAYDYGTTFSTPISYLPSGSSGVLQYRERLPQQKCEAIQLLINEVTTGVSGEYIDFTDLTFEAGIKRGINKMAASQSVG